MLYRLQICFVVQENGSEADEDTGIQMKKLPSSHENGDAGKKVRTVEEEKKKKGALHKTFFSALKREFIKHRQIKCMA